MVSQLDKHLVLIDSFLIPLTFNLVSLALPLKGLAVGLSEGIVASILFASNIVQVFGRPLFGYLSDRYGAKKFIILASTLYFAAYYTLYTATNLFILFAGAIFLGLAVSSQWSALFSYISKRSWGNLADITGSTLSLSFFGGVIGLAFSGLLIELYGVNKPFEISYMISLITLLTVIPLKSVSGSTNVVLKESISVTISNIGSTFILTNSLAVFPLIRTYGALLMLSAGLSESIIGYILTSYRLINSLMQKISSKMSKWVIKNIAQLNITALVSFIIFATLLYNKMVLISLIFFFSGSMLSSLLPTAQLVRSMSNNVSYSASGVAGFGTGLSIGRITSTGIGSLAGGLEEQNGTGLSPPFVAFVTPLVVFLFISVVYKYFRRIG